MKIGLVLTNDWELYGDGSGDYFEVQHKPLNELLNVLKEYKAKITIMAEVAQQFSHKRLSQEAQWAKEVSLAWEAILKEVIKQGHDVQLHLHPQWTNAVYKNGKWILNMDKWSLPKLNSHEIANLFEESKNYLESVLKTVQEDYKCISFRAGALCIQPSEEIIKTMRALGVKCDSSVTKGIKSLGFYDFEKAFSNVIPWHTDKIEVSNKGSKSTGILEIPIYTKIGYESDALKKYFPNLYYWIKFRTRVNREDFNWQKERERIKEIRYPRSNRFYKKSQKNLRWYLNAIFSKKAFHLDYDYLPPQIFVNSIKKILNEKDVKELKYNDSIIPVVALGHIKDIHNCDNIRRILDLIDKELKDEVVYWTLTDAVNYWYDRAEQI